MKPLYLYITIAVLVLLMGTGVFFYMEKNKKDGLGEAAKDAINESDLSYSEVEFETFADKLFIAMDGGGTEEEIVVDMVKKMRTPSDWYKLIDTFGERQTTSIFSSFKGNLIEWITDEILDSSIYMQQIKEHLQLIGIQF